MSIWLNVLRSVVVCAGGGEGYGVPALGIGACPPRGLRSGLPFCLLFLGGGNMDGNSHVRFVLSLDGGACDTLMAKFKLTAESSCDDVIRP